MPESRRAFLGRAGRAGVLAGIAGCAGGADPEPRPKAGISPAECLMRGHGVLNRILLIYEEAGRRLRGGTTIDPEAIAAAAGLLRDFIEDYHEKLEEDELFPRFRQAGRLVPLTSVLCSQHCAGHGLTEEILMRSSREKLRTPPERSTLADRLDLFVRMYRPHEAREDTVLFPALYEMLEPGEIEALAATFREREESLLGGKGFERVVAETAEIERSLGIFDLSQYTPAP